MSTATQIETAQTSHALLPKSTAAQTGKVQASPAELLAHIRNLEPIAIENIHWRDISPFPDQPRTFFDARELEGLARSISQMGQRQPIQVRIMQNGTTKYQLIEGQRRWHAVQMAGRKTLRAEIYEVDDVDVQYLASVVANFARADHTPLEIALAAGKLQRQKFTIEQIADAFGRTTGFVNLHVRLLKLHPDLQLLLKKGKAKDTKSLPGAVARILTELELEKQLEAWAELRRGSVTALRAKTIVERMLNKDPKSRNPTVQDRARLRKPSDVYRLLKSFVDLAKQRTQQISELDIAYAFLGRPTEHQPEMAKELRELAKSIEAMAQKLEPAMPKAKRARPPRPAKSAAANAVSPKREAPHSRKKK